MEDNNYDMPEWLRKAIENEENTTDNQEESKQDNIDKLIEEYERKYEKLWKDCSVKGRGPNAIPASLGAIPRTNWQKFVKENIHDVDIIENVLQVMEELAINGDAKKALEIFDGLNLADGEVEKFRNAVKNNMPHIPDFAEDKEQRGIAIMEFNARANIDARQERIRLKQEIAEAPGELQEAKARVAELEAELSSLKGQQALNKDTEAQINQDDNFRDEI